MPNPFRRSVTFQAGPLVPVLLLCLLSLTPPHAIGQSTTPSTPPTGLEKVLGRIDLSVGAVGIITDSDSGIEQRDAAGTISTTTVGSNTTTVTTSPTSLSIRPSNTVGELVTLRYIAKPYVGFEFNFGNSRYTQNFNFANTIKTTTTNPASTTTVANNPNYVPGGAQAGVREETLGYVAHLHPILGLEPYLGAGGGTMRFKPTAFGGEGLPQQYRAVYYYNAGVEDYFPTYHLGVRAGFRQLIYLAPDFGQNYLTITRRARTSEPTFGFFLRF